MPPILTPHLELRDFTLEDFSAVHRYGSDPTVTKYLSWGPNTGDQTREFLEMAVQHAAEWPRANFELAVVDRERGDLIGGCGLLARRAQYREYELGYCFRPDAWGRGVGTETVRALVAFGFQTIGAHRILAYVDPANTASSRLLKRVGFRLEGQHRRDTFVRGEWFDSLSYAMLAEEWSVT